MSRDEAIRIVDSLYESWYGQLSRYGCRLTGRMDLAEELVQEAFMQLYLDICAGKEILNPKAWTLSVVRHAAYKQVFRNAMHETHMLSADFLDQLVSPAPSPEALMEVDDFSRMLSLLSRREGEVLRLRIQSLKYREIGQKLGISTNSVNVLLARALRKLQTVAHDGGVQRSPEGGHVPKTLLR